MSRSQSSNRTKNDARTRPVDYGRRHLIVGWWTLGIFLSLGIALETMHGFKVGYYLAVDNETRRLMWRLAHAHGGLLGLIHMALATTASTCPNAVSSFASRALVASTILLPGGFFLGGLIIFDGDPGAGIVLVPIGAFLLFLSVFSIALGVSRKAT